MAEVKYLSYTGWAKYLKCPQQYYQEYVLGNRPKDIDERNVLNGNAIHQLMEMYIKNGSNNTDWLINNAQSIWQYNIDTRNIVWRGENDKAELWAKMDKWTRSLADIFDRTSFDVQAVTSELKADTNVLIGGKYELRMGARLDIVFNTENRIILDLKGSENRQVMAFDQLVWYSIVLGEFLGDHSNTNTAGYLLPGFNEVKLYQIPDEAKRNLVLRLEKTLDKMYNDEWGPKPSNFNCKWCPVKDLCPISKIDESTLVPNSTGIISL